jgi:hypothetical protein
MTTAIKTASERERELFEAWRKRTTKIKKAELSVALSGFGDDAKYFNDFTRMAWSAWQARASLPSLPEGEPELPESEFCAWMHKGEAVNAFNHGVGDRARWDYDGYWSKKGFDRAPLFTADQMRDYGRQCAALAAGRAEPTSQRVQARIACSGCFRYGCNGECGGDDMMGASS